MMESKIFNNSSINIDDFLANYWNKKPILLKNAIKVENWITPDELAGMCLDGINSRIVIGNHKLKNWQLKSAPFDDDVFSKLPKKDWTLLVQGVDRFEPQIYDLIDNFNFIPRWKFDDVMMSYATTGGSVGPHFDLYGVFLLQTNGKRKWQLSDKNCVDENYNKGFPLKVMQEFECETEIIAEVGDILYVPPKIAHFGVGLDDNCTTLSFGYRSYQAIEIADYVERPIKNDGFYQETQLVKNNNPSKLTIQAVESANKLTGISIDEFAEFITKTDLADEEILQEMEIENFSKNNIYVLNPCLKIAYTENENKVFIDGSEFKYEPNQQQNIINFCNTRKINGAEKLTKELFSLGFLCKFI